MPTLVIVDMQSQFPACERVVDQVCDVITMADDEGWNIVVLTYRGEGILNPDVNYRLAEVDDERVAYAEKSHDDGGLEVLQACEEHGFDTDHLVFVGVNADACIPATIAGVTSISHDTRCSVIRSACATENEYFRWSDFTVELPGDVHVVRTIHALL